MQLAPLSISMASTTLSLSFFSLLIFFISAHGRSLQKNYRGESVDLSHDFSFQQRWTGKTNYSDALGLLAIVTQYSWLEEANVDPCIAPTWTWIECNSDASPRVIALNLANKILVGTLPDFSTMDALQRIDLSQNALYGLIPSFLGTFPDLKELNLASNLFSGLVPDSLACNKNLDLTLDGNTGLYTSSKCSTKTSNNNNNNNIPSDPTNSGGSSFDVPVTARSKKKKSNTPAIVGGTASTFVVLWIAAGVFAIFRHKAKAAAAVADASKQETKEKLPVEEMPMNNARSNDMSP